MASLSSQTARVGAGEGASLWQLTTSNLGLPGTGVALTHNSARLRAVPPANSVGLCRAGRGGGGVAPVDREAQRLRPVPGQGPRLSPSGGGGGSQVGPSGLPSGGFQEVKPLSLQPTKQSESILPSVRSEKTKNNSQQRISWLLQR